MSDGVLYKSNASGWSKSVCKKSNASGWTDGRVKHSNGSSWFDNYPMEQLYENYFNVTWTQAYNGSGVKLDAATYGDHPRAGDSINFNGLFGFNNDDMKNFVAGGIIQNLKIEVMFVDPAHSGNPTVSFMSHTYKSKPTNYSGAYVNELNAVTSQFFQTGGNFTRWITLPIACWENGNMGGVYISAPATAGNSARFAGKTTSHGITAFNSRLYIQVIK